MNDNKLPCHVGIIMDGNGRWAKQRHMLRSFGHKAGMDRMIGLAEHAQNRGIRYFTVYALSTENLMRPKEELDGLFRLFRKYFTSNVRKLYDKNAEIKVIGDFSGLPEDTVKLLKEGVENSPKEAGFTFVLAINYGGRDEIVRAVNSAVRAGKEVDKEGFEKLLYTDGIPYPDLIIRTGGEKRLSNFLLYQGAYAELYFSDMLFPDYTDEEFDIALEDFSKRNRRFGKV